MAIKKDYNGNIKVLLVEADVSLPQTGYDRSRTDFKSLLHNGPKFLNSANPGIIICSLFGQRYDAIDVAELIFQAKIKPKLLLVAPVVPKPAMILTEMRIACPNLNVDFYQPALLPRYEVELA